MQSRLAARFAGGEVIGAVVGVAVRAQVRVGLRAPLGVVHAVDDASQLPSVLSQHAIQAPAALRRLALPCVPADTVRLGDFHSR